MEPEIVAPVSAHPALHKACHYFGIKLVPVPTTPDMRCVLKQQPSEYMNQFKIELIACTRPLL